MIQDHTKKLRSAEVLLKYSSLRNHPTFKTTDCQIGQVDWDLINKTNWTFHQAVLVEVFKFILLEESNVSLDDLMVLDPLDRQAIILALNTRFEINALEENLRG